MPDDTSMNGFRHAKIGRADSVLFGYAVVRTIGRRSIKSGQAIGSGGACRQLGRGYGDAGDGRVEQAGVDVRGGKLVQHYWK